MLGISVVIKIRGLSMDFSHFKTLRFEISAVSRVLPLQTQHDKIPQRLIGGDPSETLAPEKLQRTRNLGINVLIKHAAPQLHVSILGFNISKNSLAEILPSEHALTLPIERPMMALGLDT
jgi:hypothetical protein